MPAKVANVDFLDLALRNYMTSTVSRVALPAKVMEELDAVPEKHGRVEEWAFFSELGR